MRPTTRQLLGAMADEGVDALVRVLHDGPRSEAELRESAGLTHRAAHERLTKLSELGVVESTTRKPEGRGRPAREWALTRSELVARFAEQADEFARGLRGDGAA